MVRVSVKELNAVTAKVEAFVGERVANELATVLGTSICAGIKGSSVLQKRARINHYGGSGERRLVVKRWDETRTPGGRKRFIPRKIKMTIPYRIPERHFIDSAVTNGIYGEANKKIVEYIQKHLQGHGRVSSYNGGFQYTQSRETLFSKGTGVTRFLSSIGKAMVENQKEALVNTEPNAPSTVKRKGRNTPMRETYELYNNLDWWTESV